MVIPLVIAMDIAMGIVMGIVIMIHVTQAVALTTTLMNLRIMIPYPKVIPVHHLWRVQKMSLILISSILISILFSSLCNKFNLFSQANDSQD